MTALSFSRCALATLLLAGASSAQVIVSAAPAAASTAPKENFHVDLDGVAFGPMFADKVPVGLAANDPARKVYLSTILNSAAGSAGTLWEWDYDQGPPTMLGKVKELASGNWLRLDGLAWRAGKLYAVQASEFSGLAVGIYEVNLVAMTATSVFGYDVRLLVAGLGYDPTSDLFYGTNDNPSYPAGRGLIAFDLAGQAELFIAPYPAGVGDVDGCAVDPGGRVFLVEDEVGVLHTYDLAGGAYDPNPPALPFTQTWIHSAGAWAPGLIGPIGTPFCGPGNPNSTGLPAEIFATGVTRFHGWPLQLTATQLPTNQFGYFLASKTQGFVPNPGGSQGNLCLGGAIGRFALQVQNSGSAGSFSIDVDTLHIPQPGGDVAIQFGETWNFQAWHRDTNPGSTSNFTDGISVTY